jgi:3-hydroxypropanoate dehydrogenase
MNAPARIAADTRLAEADLDLLFREARTFNAFQDRPVSDALLTEAIELAKMGPTAANTLPMRVVFVKSAEAKEKLKPSLSAGNVDKTMAAPVTAIVAYDREFFEKLPRLFPHADARSWFAGNAAFAEKSAAQSSTLQAAYLILALRALGLDTGPMTGFDADKVDAAFFADEPWHATMLINIGYGDREKLFGRLPRLDAGEIARFA